MYKILFTILMSFLSINLVQAGTRDPNVPDSKYINYAKDFHFVGKVCGKYNDGSAYCASGVAISDYIMITAAHVVDKSESCQFNINNKKCKIKEVIIHKDFDESKFGLNDIAICISEESFDLKFYPGLYTEKDEIGKVCSISGYGITGTFNTGAKLSDDTRRAGSNKIDYIDKQLLICSPSKDNSKTQLEFLIASGDSGGGLFIDGKLAGINSCVMAVKGSPNSSYGSESGHTRISDHAEWIKKVLE